MKDKLWLLSIKLKNTLAQEDGQQLIEYILLAACLAFLCTVGMKSLATSINSAFGTIGTDLTNAVG